MAAVAVLLASCASFKHLTQASSAFPTAKECGKCHVDSFKTARAVLTRRSYDREALVLAETQVEVAKP